jgi:hypothetical protein
MYTSHEETTKNTAVGYSDARTYLLKKRRTNTICHDIQSLYSGRVISSKTSPQENIFEAGSTSVKPTQITERKSSANAKRLNSINNETERICNRRTFLFMTKGKVNCPATDELVD